MFIPEEILPENISVKSGEKQNIDIKYTTTQEISVSTTLFASGNWLWTAEPTLGEPAQPQGSPQCPSPWVGDKRIKAMVGSRRLAWGS